MSLGLMPMVYRRGNDIVGPFWRIRHVGAAPGGGIWDFLATGSAAGFISENATISGTNYGNSANRLDIKWQDGTGAEAGWTAAGTPSGDPWQGGNGQRYTGTLSSDSNYSIQLALQPIIPRAIRISAPSGNADRIPGEMRLEHSADESTWAHWATLTTTGGAATGIYDFLSITQGGTIAATES